MTGVPDTDKGRGRPADPSDETLVEWIAAGEQDALSTLYDRYRGLMYGMATRITGDPGLAQDVVQEAFLGIWRNATRYVSGRASARTWILSITHHRAVDAVRRRRPTVEMPEPDAPAAPSQLVLPGIWPEVSQRIDAGSVRSALAALPPAQREAITLAYFSGLTQQEIAQRTDAPLGTVKSRVRLGLLQLRRLLGDDVSELDGDGAVAARTGETARPEGAGA